MSKVRWRLVTVILLEIQFFPLMITQTPSMICDSTCFGIPLGQIGCRLTPQPDLPRFQCTEWRPVQLADITPDSDSPKLGEVCVNLEPLSEEGSIFGHSSRQNYEGQEGIGDVYTNAKDICESFPYGSLFNPKVLFKRRKCTKLYMSEKSEAEQDYLIDDMGVVQSAIASILPPDTHYYVNAEKNESLTASLGSAVYSYENTEDEAQLSKAPLHHRASSSNGNCLSYSSSLTTTTTTDEFGTTITTVSSSLQSVGVDCESKLQPLCFREVAASDLEFINEQCSDCNDPSVTPTCNKWEKMENLYEQGDTFIVTWMEICIDVCGPEVRQANEYCSALDPRAELFNYAALYQSVEDGKNYLGAINIEDKKTEWTDGSLDLGVYLDPGYLVDLNDTDEYSRILYVDQTTPELTLGKLMARLFKKFNSEIATKTFWVNLQNKDIYCYDPCPAEPYFCCSTELSITPPPDTNSKQIQTFIKRYSWHTWVKKEYFNWQYDYTVVQNYTYEPNENLDCGAVEKKDRTTPDFFRENCKAKHRPLCMRPANSRYYTKDTDLTDAQKKRKNKDKKRTKKFKKKTRNIKKKNRKAGKGSSRRVRRQLTDTGRPIEMCATVLPALLGVCYFWPSICSNTEVTTTEPTTDVPDYYEDYEEYDYDSYADDSDA